MRVSYCGPSLSTLQLVSTNCAPDSNLGFRWLANSVQKSDFVSAMSRTVLRREDGADRGSGSWTLHPCRPPQPQVDGHLNPRAVFDIYIVDSLSPAPKPHVNAPLFGIHGDIHHHIS